MKGNGLKTPEELERAAAVHEQVAYAKKDPWGVWVGYWKDSDGVGGASVGHSSEAAALRFARSQLTRPESFDWVI